MNTDRPRSCIQISEAPEKTHVNIHYILVPVVPHLVDMVNGRIVESANYTTSSDNVEFPQPRTRIREDLSGTRSWR